MTNFEWLKSLSAEELAKWFYTEVCLMKCPAQIPPEWKESKCGDCTHIPDCDEQCTLKWLQEERKDKSEEIAEAFPEYTHNSELRFEIEQEEHNDNKE